VKEERRNITLLGLSTPDKKQWVHTLTQELNYEKGCLQEELDEVLHRLLQEEGFRGIEDLGQWLGFPREDLPPENEHQYIKCETAIILAWIARLQSAPTGVVIDAPASIVHIEDASEFRDLLRTYTTVVLLDTTEEEIERAVERFVALPEPVIWGDHYKPQEREGQKETLARCCRELLVARCLAYRKWAHYVVAPSLYRDPFFLVHDFLRLIEML